MIEDEVTLHVGFDEHLRICKWCEDHIGKRAPSKDMVYSKTPWTLTVSFGYTWHFANEKDATLFLLRWE